jgi:hypothetical protein
MKVAPVEQHDGLDDLHPGGGRHAAEEHIAHHQHTDDDHRVDVFHAEQHLDQLTGADHLGDHVESHDDQRTGGGKAAHRRLREAIGSHVGKGELAQVAQTLGHQEGDHRPADQPADREDQAVKAVGEHQTGDPEEGRRGHVVTGNRQTVLKAGNATAGGVEVGRRLGLRRGPLGDPQGNRDEDGEHRNRHPVGRLFRGVAEVGTGSENPAGGQQAESQAKDVASGFADHFLLASLMTRHSCRRTRYWPCGHRRW